MFKMGYWVSNYSGAYAALKTGFFQVTIPIRLMQHIRCILNFLTSFSYQPQYTHGFNSIYPEVAAIPLLGFMIDNFKPMPGQIIHAQNNQVWRLGLKQGPEGNFWSYFPQEVQAALAEYKLFKIQVLNGILDKIRINPTLREQLTCGVTSGTNDDFALFNDFRNDIKSETGLRQHKDYGILTALLSPAYQNVADAAQAGHSGLEVYIDPNIGSAENKWYSVVPTERVIIFNFGAALEESMKNFPIMLPGLPPVNLAAAVHRVSLTPIRRFSFANFGDPPFTATIPYLNGSNISSQSFSTGIPYSEFVLQMDNALYA
ncbi:MAG: hypothetical protein K5Q00_04830 [Gammaproteobacteria bacterium]|nr:hypothetical protein [Gammaproteobacteria bacterium]